MLCINIVVISFASFEVICYASFEVIRSFASRHLRSLGHWLRVIYCHW